MVNGACDLISRQAAIDAVDDGAELIRRVLDNMDVVGGERSKFAWGLGLLESCIYELNGLPSAQSEQRWIPCSERLPEDDTLMLVNYIDHRPDAVDIWIGWHEMENVWYINGEEHSKERGNEVVAWMPLPEPYGERKEE